MATSCPQAGSKVGVVAEIQGLYGPFLFPEKLLQKIWLRGDFDHLGTRLVDGRPVTVLDPGRWNLLGGPDFRGARLRIGDGPEFEGDVEIHVHASDWTAHGHAGDPAYDGVGLHVVLFAPDLGHSTRRKDGQEIPVLALLPLLHHDLEQFAAEEVVESLTGRLGDAPPEKLVGLAPGDLTELLHRHARERWRQKVRFAQLRIQRVGWEAACHQTALEILGYRFNRAPMLRVAARWPLAEWGRPDFDSDAALASERGRWSVQGVRPANRPCARLRQYAAWVRARPDWPQRLASGDPGLCVSLSDSCADTRLARQKFRLPAWRRRFVDLCGGAVGGTRLDNLACDGFWPLLAAVAGSDPQREVLWFHWWPRGPAAADINVPPATRGHRRTSPPRLSGGRSRSGWLAAGAGVASLGGYPGEGGT